MGIVILHMSMSLDGSFEGLDGDISWHRMDEELHQFVNDGLIGVPTYLEGRRSYQLMEEYWPTADESPDATPAERQYADIWRGTHKVVVSRTLTEVGPNATLVRDVDEQLVRSLTEQGDVVVGGADLAAYVAGLGLLDELRIFVNPVVLGVGRELFPAGLHLELELLESRPFPNGVVLLRYAVQH